MSWAVVYVGAAQAVEREGERVPIPPFAVQVAGLSEILIEASSSTVPDYYWAAGWVNLHRLDGGLPTFEALVVWRRLPLGKFLMEMPSTGVHRIEIDIRTYIDSITIRIWGK